LRYQLHTSISRSRIGQDPHLTCAQVRPTSGVSALIKQSRYWASIERVLVDIRSV